MTRRLAVAVTWLLAGEALAGWLFWVLLGVPGSSIWTLGLSCLVGALMLETLLWTTGGVFALWRRPGAPAVTALREGWRHAVPVMAGTMLFLGIWWATARAITWHQAYAGQIDAWIIARSGRSQTQWLHDGIEYVIWILRWGIGLTLALALVADVVATGWPALGQARWVRRAFHPRLWITVAVLVGLTQFLPWHYVNWRPQRMSLGTEPWFVGAKLAAMAILSAAGAALAVRVVTPTDNRPSIVTPTNDRPS